MIKHAGLAVLCFLLPALAFAAAAARSDGEESFWNDMAKPSNVTSTTTFKGEYMEYFSSGPVLYLKGLASISDSSSTLTADRITATMSDKRTWAVGRARLVLLTTSTSTVKTSSGTVTSVQTSTVSVSSNEMTLLGGEKRLIAVGHAQTIQEDRLIRGSRIDYNWALSTGTVVDASGFEPPWRFSGSRMVQTGPKTYNLYHAKFTTCDLEFPHYFFKSSFAQLVREKRLTGINNELSADDMPLFYTPFFNHLFKQALTLQVKPGQSSRDGLVFRNNLYYGFQNGSYVRLYGDYLQKTGNGYGGEVAYFRPHAYGSFYVYQVTDHNPDLVPAGSPPGATAEDVRRTVRIADWHKLTPRLTLQANINYQSDQNFNNNFFQSNSERVINPGIGALSQVALTHQLPWLTTRLSSSRTDSYDPNNNGAQFIQDWAMPSFSFNTISLKSRYLPFLSTFSGSYSYNEHRDNSTAVSTDTYSGQLNASFNKAIPLSKTLTFTPTLGLQENWTRTTPLPTDASPDQFTNRTTETLAFRKRLTHTLDLDFSHSATIRSVNNKFVTDRNALDRGIEANGLNFDLFSSPRPGTWARLASGYNLRTPDQDGIVRGTSGDFTGPAADSAGQTILQRLNSPNLEINTRPRKDLEFYIRELYNLYPVLHNGVTQGRVTWNPNQKTYLQSSIAYNNGTPGTLQLTLTGGLNITPEWRIQGDLEYQVTGTEGGIHYDTFSPTSREIKITRTLHCWEFSIHVTDRPGLRQALFNVQLKTDALATKNVSTMEQEEQLYPWRQPWKE